jgi:peptidoglycan hydrolase CwlO-like protein
MEQPTLYTDEVLAQLAEQAGQLLQPAAHVHGLVLHLAHLVQEVQVGRLREGQLKAALRQLEERHQADAARLQEEHGRLLSRTQEEGQTAAAGLRAELEQWRQHAAQQQQAADQAREQARQAQQQAAASQATAEEVIRTANHWHDEALRLQAELQALRPAPAPESEHVGHPQE